MSIDCKLVTIPPNSDRPRFYPAMRDGQGWSGVALAKQGGVVSTPEYYPNVIAARDVANQLIKGGASVDAIVYVSRTGYEVLKLGEKQPCEDHPDYGSW